MAHFRKIIRDRVALLVTGLTTTGGRVFSGRVAPLTDSELPGLVIVPGNEVAGFGAEMGGGTVDREFDLIVIAEALGGDGLFDVLDTIAGEVEAALFDPAHDNLDGLAIWVSPPRTEIFLSDEQGRSDKRRAQMRMSFAVTYRTALSDPTQQA